MNTTADDPLSVYGEYALTTGSSRCDWRVLSGPDDVARIREHLARWRDDTVRCPLLVHEAPEAPPGAAADAGTADPDATDLVVWMNPAGPTPRGALAYVVLNDAARAALIAAATPLHQTIDGLLFCLIELGEIRAIVRPVGAPMTTEWHAFWSQCWMRTVPDVSVAAFLIGAALIVLLVFAVRRHHRRPPAPP